MKMEQSGSVEQSTIEKCLTSLAVSDSGRVTGVFRFASDFPAFAGHFPGQPVLPAVVQLAAVRLLAARHLGKHLVPKAVDRAKFRAIIGPAEPVTIKVDIEQLGNDDVTISFSIATDATVKAATGEISCLVQDNAR